MEFDQTMRYVSALQTVDGYATVDLRLGWRSPGKLEWSLVGRNLVQGHHAEFPGAAGAGVEVKRSVYAKVTLQW